MKSRDLHFEKTARNDYIYWRKADRKIFEKINFLIEQTLKNPFSGLGKPEALKGELSGFWSRRISGEHRLVYMVEDDKIIIAQCRYHYAKKS